jgi:hypothetical protein
VRALVPEGFMPAQGELIELCTIHGPRTVMTDPVTGELVDPDEVQSAPPCPFSLLLSALALPPNQALHVGTAIAVAQPPLRHLLPTTRPSLALPPARAPPSPHPA